MSIHSEKTNLSIRHMRAALAVAEEGSFVAAASRLSVVPSALTETIRQIEQYTGVILFDRKRRPVSPTSNGAVFLQEAEQIVQDFDASLRRLRQVGGMQAGHVTIAVSPSLLQKLLGPCLPEFKASYPGISLAIRDDVAGRVEELVAGGDADFGLAARWQENREIEYLPVGADVFGLVCHQGHALAQMRGDIFLKDINPAEIISLRTDTGIAQMLGTSPAIPDALRSGQFVAHSTIAQLLLIAQNLGVSLLPEYAAGVLGGQQITYRPIADLHLERQLYLMRRRAMALSPAASQLFEFLQSRSQILGDTGSGQGKENFISS